MLLPQQCDDTLNVSPSSKSEVPIFALDHINFGGSANPFGSEVSISTEFMVNCLYGHGMVQLVLTTLVAASQLLFMVNKAPASPRETDDGNSKQDGKDETDHS
ncbi:hypothetical protein PVL29_004721 [Vitis rotundifolia]|uniref:Uncharacterized protein n=1 Tax=Vitis rotundifolia TaxID=103349 RepID=A0AA39A8X9_VITRO|nr:hypothetical protein PVL29_004721 [Vitis rotundifolia]